MNGRITIYFLLLFLFAFSNNIVQAQAKISTAKSSITFTEQNGSWTFSQYPYNIIKVTYSPYGYKRSENITNAVILKPLPGVPPHKKIIQRDENFLLTGQDSISIRFTQDTFGYKGFSFELKGDEKIFGGGERALPLNRRGYKFPLYNNPWYGYSNGADALNFSVPFFTSSKGYGLFFDNASKGYADIGKTNSNVFEVGFISGELTAYIIPGKDYKEILSSYYKLTGTQPLPPRWAMGNFMSRFGYTSEAQTKEIAEKMRKENIPFDAIIFDLFWFGDSIKRTMGNLDWVNTTAWPNPKKMIGDFKKENIKSVLIAEPFVLENTKQYDFAKKYFAVDSAGKPFRLTDFYFGYGGLIDIFRKDAASAIWNRHYKKQLANGVTGWWTDLGEPEKHPSAIMHNLKDFGIKRLMGADEVHNIYGHYWNKMLFDNYAKELPNERLFHLNRSGFAGSQRYSIFPWSGDVSRSWSGLQAQIPLMLGMSMSGIPYIHADAGGFAGGEGDNELYVRWLQYAAFTPIFRPHGTALFEKDTAAYSFPSEPALIDTPWRAYAKQSVELRYLMLPYNYTLAYKQTTKGEPLVAPLYYHYPKDTAAVNVNDEFMWGENILVAPVLEKGAKERKVYLPEGKWYELFSEKFFTGGVSIIAPLTIEHIPVFVKEGSFIPMWHKFSGTPDNSVNYDLNDIQIIYFPSVTKSTGILYEDDGVSKASRPEVISFSGITIKNKMIISIKTSNKSLYQKGVKRILRIGCPEDFFAPVKGKLNSKIVREHQISVGRYEVYEQQNFNFIDVEFDGNPTHLEIFLNQSEK